ncbi:hypothetical protein [Marinibactrum halimedae]|nr:hypothetical protein [Marinibactrum halimedae]MCD9458162.1 hypothetical protein [Marinibactrum halimedae]
MSSLLSKSRFKELCTRLGKPQLSLSFGILFFMPLIEVHGQSVNLPSHFDVDVTVRQTPQGAQLFINQHIVDGNDVYPLPVDYDTRHLLVPSVFGTPDAPVNDIPHKTDDPGWLMSASDMLDDEILWFRALGELRYWSPDTQSWETELTGGEQVILYGGLPPGVLFGDPEELAFWQSGTQWSQQGVEGPTESVIEYVNGGIHAHLDFCVKDSEGTCVSFTRRGRRLTGGISDTGNPQPGAYLIEMQMFSTAEVESGVKKYRDSEPFFIIFRQGISEEEFLLAQQSLVSVPQIETQPVPAAGILIMN